MNQYLTVVLSLCFVVGLIYLTAWILKKINFAQSTTTKNDSVLLKKTTLQKGYYLLSFQQGETQQTLLQTPTGVCLLNNSENANHV